MTRRSPLAPVVCFVFAAHCSKGRYDAWVFVVSLQTEKIDEAVYNHIHVLLRDRIHLVNRYERLRAIDPEQAANKRVSIHERLRSIAKQVGDAQKQLRRSSKVQAKIQAHISKNSSAMACE